MAWRSRGHRGDILEDLILLSNEYYNKNNFARIDKVSTPIKVIDIGSDGLITKGYFEKKSTVDFVGVVQGVAIAFDAKETSVKNIPLYNIHEHQIEYMRDFSYQGGLAFIIVHYTATDDYFLVPFETIDSYYKGSQSGGRKSIPYSAMMDRFKIKREINGLLNYLPVLNEYIIYKSEL